MRIRPSSGVGNQLILENQAGTTVLSTSDTGATLTSNVDFPAGHVIQVVSNSPDLAQTSTSSTSYVTTGLSQAITPAATSSKIYITVTINVSVASAAGCMLTIYRDSTNLAPGGNDSSHAMARLYVNGASDTWENAALQYLDSPNTTSAITYACYYKAETGSSSLYAGGWTAPTITLMEIAG